MFFFSSRRRHTRLQGDWSSDVCSSDLSASARASTSVPPPAAKGTMSSMGRWGQAPAGACAMAGRTGVAARAVSEGVNWRRGGGGLGFFRGLFFLGVFWAPILFVFGGLVYPPPT